MPIVLLTVILLIAVASLAINGLFIAHELGWFPHSKDRTSPADRAFQFRSRYEADVHVTHDFQVLDPNTDILRAFGHPDIYSFKDPYQALENVIKRYEELPTRSRYDDLIHLSNHICNRVLCDDKVNALIGRIHQLIHDLPMRRE